MNATVTTLTYWDLLPAQKRVVDSYPKKSRKSLRFWVNRDTGLVDATKPRTQRDSAQFIRIWLG